MADNNKILAMFEMIRQDYLRIETRLNNLNCEKHAIAIQKVDNYVARKLKDEEIARHTFIKEIVKYSIPSIIMAVCIIIANVAGVI